MFNNIKYEILKRGQSPLILNRLETSKRISHGVLCVARFGDGELGMVMDGNSLGFQRKNDVLSQRLLDVLQSNQEGLLLCLPDVFNGLASMRKAPSQFWKKWVISHKHALMSLKIRGPVFGDAFVTRLYIPWKDKSKEKEILDNLQKAWENKNLVVVEGEKTRCGVGNDLFSNASSVQRILCPAENAWDKYDIILETCLKVPHDENVVFYLALGPTATVLAYDLCVAGYRALDLGHLDLQYEYMLRGMDNKGIIPGKYNNEIAKGNIVEDIDDLEYESSIIARI